MHFKRIPVYLVTTAMAGLLPLSLAKASDKVTQPILLGAALAQSTNVGLLGQDQVEAVRVAEDYFNAQGGINGTTFKVAVEDSAGDEVSAINAFNALIRKQVVGLIGPTLSQQAFAADPIANRLKIPVIAPSNTAKGIPQIGDFVARVSAPVSIVAPYAVKAALKQNPKIKNVAVMYAHNDAFSVSETASFQDAVKSLGLNVTTIQKFQTTDTDFTSQATNVVKIKPELIIISGLAADSGNLVKQLRQLGYKGIIVGGNGFNTPHILPICQQSCDGVLVAQAYSAETTAQNAMNKEFVDVYRKKYSKDPGQIPAQAFTAVQVMVEALRHVDKAKKITSMTLGEVRLALNAQILAGSYLTPLGQISFDKEGEVVANEFYVAQIKINPDNKSGRFVILK